MQEVLQQIGLLSEKLCSLTRFRPQKSQWLLVNEILNNLRPLLNALIPSRISWNLSTDPEVRYIYLNPVTFEQIVLNLVLNATEAISEKGEINIYTRLQKEPDGKELVLIVVEDTGPGIPEELQEHILLPFFTTKESGTGLGLPLVKNYVEEVGGQIRLYSQEGKGTRFELVFPSVKEPPILF
jgi:two-component system sporulation sensor kinase A